MKKYLIYLFLSQRHRLDRSMKRKLFIIAGVGGFVLLLGLGATAFVGVKAAGYVMGLFTSQNQIGSAAVGLKTEGQKILGQATSPGCLAEIQNHMRLDPWLNRPISESTSKLGKACFGMKPSTENETGGNYDQGHI